LVQRTGRVANFDKAKSAANAIYEIARDYAYVGSLSVPADQDTEAINQR
jgi:hypothetical protein